MTQVIGLRCDVCQKVFLGEGGTNPFKGAFFTVTVLENMRDAPITKPVETSVCMHCLNTEKSDRLIYMVTRGYQKLDPQQEPFPSWQELDGKK